MSAIIRFTRVIVLGLVDFDEDGSEFTGLPAEAPIYDLDDDDDETRVGVARNFEMVDPPDPESGEGKVRADITIRDGYKDATFFLLLTADGEAEVMCYGSG